MPEIIHLLDIDIESRNVGPRRIFDKPLDSNGTVDVERISLSTVGDDSTKESITYSKNRSLLSLSLIHI